jgi:diaminohydroxyphosphoribosylaminopyrimidine deaminase / 5-amino-6-(5-phosphoribosylamino)uracil reductase
MTGFSEAERAAMRRALAIAATPGVPLGPNPRVGCVLLDGAGRQVAEGYHRGAGGAHAEVAALQALRVPARGLTAVVTLEPCDHTGRTGPCSRALAEAGVARVVYALADPHLPAAGGAETLRAAGVDVAVGLEEAAAEEVNRHWLFALRHARPFVTWKLAASLDGRSSAADGTSRWVSNAASRADTHRRRAQADVIMVGTGTVLADDPWLTVRDPSGVPLPRELQPLRVVVGERQVPLEAKVRDDAAETWFVGHRDLRAALAELFARGRRHVFLEGGPRLAGALLEAGLVDEVVAYVAPALLGGGVHAVEGLGVGTITEAHRLDVLEVTTIGEGLDVDVRMTLRPRSRGRGDTEEEH